MKYKGLTAKVIAGNFKGVIGVIRDYKESDGSYSIDFQEPHTKLNTLTWQKGEISIDNPQSDS